ncbi:MAG TPA: hypothetical protein PLV51_01345 [Lentimicrobium sp.]|jgi:hypothetical protein|nr:hypothetical protein [Lentimicrobium sp.]
MKLLSVYAVAVINLLLTVYYYLLIFRKKIKPSLAMWVFFTLAVSMSLFTYIKEDSHSLWDNVLNTTDLFFVSAVALSILLFGDRSTRFSRFDLLCLSVVILIAVFWLITQNHLVTNLLVQAILVIAYFPVIHRMIRTRENHESYPIWGGMLLAAVLALFSASGELALVYTLRAVICIVLLMAFMRYTDYRSKRSMTAGERT